MVLYIVRVLVSPFVANQLCAFIWRHAFCSLYCTISYTSRFI